MKRHFMRLTQIFIVLAGALSCTGANLYKDLVSNRTSDEALFEDAQKLIDSGDYTAAIDKLLSTTTDFQATTRVKESLAGAYAGRCGMEFLPFVTNLTGGSSSSLFSMAMNGFVGVDTSNYADCETADAIIESIGTLNNRTQSENLFMLILQMAKIGNRVRSVADVAPTSTGDGTTDATFDCRDSVPIADAQIIIESFVKFLEVFSVVGSTVAGSSASTAVDNFIQDVGVPTIDYEANGVAGVDELDPAIVLARTLLNSQAFGVGSCNNADPTTCVCPP